MRQIQHEANGAIFNEKRQISDSGVGEKNDARHISTQAAHGDSRALDFNVVQVSVTRIYQKRHLFRPPGTLVSLRQTATLKSGARGADSSQVQSGVIFFANTGTPKRVLGYDQGARFGQISGRGHRGHKEQL